MILVILFLINLLGGILVKCLSILSVSIISILLIILVLSRNDYFSKEIISVLSFIILVVSISIIIILVIK